jgi:hypothetical protein
VAGGDASGLAGDALVELEEESNVEGNSGKDCDIIEVEANLAEEESKVDDDDDEGNDEVDDDVVVVDKEEEEEDIGRGEVVVVTALLGLKVEGP